MKSATPPRLACWLLFHQVGGYRAESLVGDLTEEYADGRGDGWYWGQVLLAVARSYRRALRLYGVRVLIAVAVGWCALLLGIVLLDQISAIVRQELSSLSADWSAQRLQTLNGFYAFAWTILAGCIDVVVGRLVVRIYRPHPRFIAAVFALSILVYMLPSIYGLMMQALHDSQRFAALAQELAATVLWMMSAWLGALWQIRVDIKATKRGLLS
jgi:hypothetical protein